MLYEHFSLAPWTESRWPHFQPAELACPHCGAYYHDERLLDVIQRVRRDQNRPININSGHRCPFYNATKRIGGAAFSEHKMRIAFDISLRGHDPKSLYENLVAQNISTFGFYGGFIHIDARPNRRWVSKAGRETWNGLVSF
jgi:zinc D-Ala-D-Ala carboxypeptidase